MTLAVNGSTIEVNNDRNKQLLSRRDQLLEQLAVAFLPVWASPYLLSLGIYIDVGLSRLTTRFSGCISLSSCSNDNKERCGKVKANYIPNFVVILNINQRHLWQALVQVAQSLVHPLDIDFSCNCCGVEVKSHCIGHRMPIQVFTLTCNWDTEHPPKS